jgi:hypothetical protein
MLTLQSPQIVPATSAVVPAVDAIAIALPKDHIDIVKYSSVDDLAFQTVLHHISFMIQDAIPKVTHNWERETNFCSESLTIIQEY